MVAIGSKFEATRDLDVAQIAKLIRQDIKSATRDGSIPDTYKYSVRTRRFAGGCAIDVEIVGAPELRKEYHVWREDWYDQNPEVEWRERPSAKLVESLEAIVEAYNRKDIDSMTDYFDVRFYGHVQYGYGK